MDKKELVERLAKQSHRSKGEAADQVDTLVYGLLKELKQVPSKPAKVPSGHSPKLPSVSGKGKK